MDTLSFVPLDDVELIGRADELLVDFELPVLTHLVPCGYPSPAEDHADERLDIVRRLVKHPASTYFARAQGDSMVNAGILSGAILVIDRSLHAQHGDIVLATVGSEFTCKRLYVRNAQFRLVPESDDKRFKVIEPGEGDEVTVWGVVTAAVNEFRGKASIA